MNNFIIYEKQSQQIKFLETREDNLTPALDDTFGFFSVGETVLSLEQYYVENDELKTRPAQPTPFYLWDGQQWILNDQLWNDNQAEIARIQRNVLLTESDWVVTKAKEYDKEVSQDWKIYRQALRDISKQKGFPLNIIWPTKPI